MKRGHLKQPVSDVTKLNRVEEERLSGSSPACPGSLFLSERGQRESQFLQFLCCDNRENVRFAAVFCITPVMNQVLLMASSKNRTNEEDESTILTVPEDGLFNGDFVPPPPRPLYLEEGVSSDGLTTCDLCSWAWQNGGGGGGSNSHTQEASLEPSNEIGWVLTLIIVSITSAVLGAIIMIVILRCKRLKRVNEPSVAPLPQPRPLPPDDKLPLPPLSQSSGWGGRRSWWRSSPPPSAQLSNTQLSFVENHYTHMEEALYAELDSTVDGGNPNSAYSDAPSSAYYSDLSGAYEVVGMSTMERRKMLDVIDETMNITSDYV